MSASETIVGVIGIPCRDGRARHRIPALVFGVWCAHPGNTFAGNGEEMWRVSHGPTGKALFAPCGDVDWFVAVRSSIPAVAAEDKCR